MKAILTVVCFYISFLCSAQKFAIGADRNNILYAGLDNPLTIAVANLSLNSVVVKSNIGNITGRNGSYIFSSDTIGNAVITVYKKANGKLVKLGENYFRVKKIPPPIFKIGSGKDSMPLGEVQNQNFVRAELDGAFGFDIRFSIVSFTVCIISTDTCRYIEVINKGNKIGEEMKNAFKILSKKDILFFKNIECEGPGGRQKLASRIFFLL